MMQRFTEKTIHKISTPYFDVFFIIICDGWIKSKVVENIEGDFIESY